MFRDCKKVDEIDKFYIIDLKDEDITDNFENVNWMGIWNKLFALSLE